MADDCGFAADYIGVQVWQSSAEVSGLATLPYLKRTTPSAVEQKLFVPALLFSGVAVITYSLAAGVPIPTALYLYWSFTHQVELLHANVESIKQAWLVDGVQVALAPGPMAARLGA